MSTLVVTLIGMATLAFGAVYPWAFVPLFAAAFLIGLSGLASNRLPRDMWPLAASVLLLCAAAAAQLLPLPRAIVDVISPATPQVSGAYNFSSTSDDGPPLPLSIDPARTQIAVLALGALGVYLLGLPARLGARDVRRLPCALAAFAVPLALFAVYTREHNNNLIYGFWQPYDGVGSNQAGPFINRNHFGGWMLMSICLAVGWIFGQLERALRERRGSRMRALTRAFSGDSGGLVVLMVTAVAITTISLFWVVSRSAILSFTAAVVIFVSLARRRRHIAPSQRTIFVGTLTAALVVAVSWRGLDVLVPWFLDDSSMSSRLDAWQDGWNLVKAFPVSGSGLNTYSTAMLFYQAHNPGWHMAQAHNDYLQLLAEGGALIALAVAATMTLLVLLVLRRLKEAEHEVRGYWVRAGAAVGMVAVAVQEMVEFSLQIPANAFLFATLAAIALTPVNSASSRRSRDTIGDQSDVDAIFDTHTAEDA